RMPQRGCACCRRGSAGACRSLTPKASLATPPSGRAGFPGVRLNRPVDTPGVLRNRSKASLATPPSGRAGFPGVRLNRPVDTVGPVSKPSSAGGEPKRRRDLPEHERRRPRVGEAGADAVEAVDRADGARVERLAVVEEEPAAGAGGDALLGKRPERGRGPEVVHGANAEGPEQGRPGRRRRAPA